MQDLIHRARVSTVSFSLKRGLASPFRRVNVALVSMKKKVALTSVKPINVILISMTNE